ncbi:hypothetical protein [uncultured phage cr106_1]|uniref:Uncharacterized protein n=1 Tax=uncultured phage cr106_1 TaxID=2772062 RepID=A0A7M1RXB0_9CAUD|nr:hypothetical protein KNV29_gp098 [uncultured phage cr106_1]QOR58289.1 hypothetical protein [uncultured phage cr106_1]
MKRVTSYALNCLVEQGISNENIKKLVKAIENQTRDNILTPEQAIEILLDGEIHVEKIHQQATIDPDSQLPKPMSNKHMKAVEVYI